MAISSQRLLQFYNVLPVLRYFYKENFLIRQGHISYLKRDYRGRPSHNIGRIFGLEKKKPEPLSYRLQGVWKEEQHQSSIPNAYESLNFVVEGYDMVLVEDFSKFIHRLMLRRNQKVVEVYALPSNDVEVRKMISAKQQQIEDMSVDIKLTSHKRVVQVVNIPSHQLSILLQIIMSSIPQSINFSLKKHDEIQHFLRFQRKMELEKEKEILQKLYDSK